MPTSPPSWGTSASFRLEWRPSRWLTGALLLIAVLAPFAVLQSEVPRPLAWPLAAAAAAQGAWRAWREARKPPHAVAWSATGATVQWRGPLLFLHGPDGHLSWWPDTLDAEGRRDLHRSMAP